MTDSHCHLADEAFAADVTEVVDRARAAGVARALCILDATNGPEQTRAAAVGAAWPELGFAAGVHPHQAGSFADDPDTVVPTVQAALAARPSACAVGEIGLDYHYDLAPPAIQREVFGRQIAHARAHGAPIVIHTRDADDDTVALLRSEGRGDVRGVFHCFTGDIGLARRALDLGFVLSFSGIVTFRRADALRAVAAFVPADRFLVETDAPYLAPVPHRGKRNEPAWVARVVEVLAEVRGESPEAVGEASDATFARVFAAA